MGTCAHLFRTSFLLLYLEVALLRWVGAYVPYASFFTHHVLLGALLGVSLGFFLTGRSERLLRAAPFVLLATVAAAGAFHLLHRQGLLAVRVDDPSDPDRLFFGTIWPSDEPRRLALPIEATLLAIYAGCALLFAGLGQRLGTLFEASHARLPAYAAHLAGCVLGTFAFTQLAASDMPPIVWFVPALILLDWEVRTRWASWAALAATVVVVSLLQEPPEGWRRYWSPYNRVDFQPESGLVFANGIGHQQVVDQGRAGEAYHLPYSSGAPPGRVLVIGAGTGNDVAAALAGGARHVDAVEIDPRFVALGRKHHPESPYLDRRVEAHVGDGRAFLEESDALYDCIVYGLVDSLTLHSSWSSVRLESYLFTVEALRAARQRLAPGGRLVITNYLRSGWLVARLAQQLEEVFAAPPHVYSLPPRAHIAADAAPDRALTVLCAGPPLEGLSPTTIERVDLPLARDDWPYPYLRERAVPAQNLRALAWLLLLSVGLAFVLRAPMPGRVDRHFLFLGVGFALVETTSIARLAAVVGTTWEANAAAVIGVLGTSLLGTAWAAWRRDLGARGLYVGLALALGLSALVGTGTLLALPLPARMLAAGVTLFAPVLFSGALFARSLSRCPSAARALGSNAVGVLLGIALETLSVVLGLRGMVLVIAAAYALSVPRRA